jgi:uncharacterized repeat protein (TIGR03803 family)
MQIVQKRVTSSAHLSILSGTLILLAACLPGSAATSQQSGPTLTTLHSFEDGSDGAAPQGGLVLSSAGVLYGTTADGGDDIWGTVFEMTPPQSGQTTWTEKVLYSFTGGSDGANPMGDLVIGASSVLYGVTNQGGANNYGAVFELLPGTGGVWTEKVIYSFKGGTDGANPVAGLVLNSAGTLYGTTVNGGTAGYGTVFSVTPAGGGNWTEKVIYSFQGGTTDGANPMGPVTLNSNSSPTTIYGTTYSGGADSFGTVFQLTISSGVEAILYSFTATNGDGADPWARLILNSGSLYGTTFWGGNLADCTLSQYALGCGIAFELTPPTSGSGPWTESILYTFTGGAKDGAHPYGDLVLSPTQDLVGSTFSGGSQLNVCFAESFPGCGTVFQLKPPTTQGNPWTETILESFNGDDGGGPNGVLLVTSNGDIFGTTYVGGIDGGFGTVFELIP